MACFADTAPFVANRLGIARGHIARDQIAEAGIAPLQKVVTFVLGDLIGWTLIPRLHRHPDAPVIAKRLAHQRELRLIAPGNRDAGGMDLSEARVGERSAPLVGPPDSGAVGAFRVGRQIINVAVATGAQDDGVGDVRLDPASDQVAGDDPAGLAVYDHQVQHLGARKHGHAPGVYLAFERLICAQKKLLAVLTARVEGARSLRSAEGPVGQRSAVLARKGHSLGGALIDNIPADLCQPVDIPFARSKLAALYGVITQPEHAVAVTVIVLSGVDAALCGDAVRGAG